MGTFTSALRLGDVVCESSIVSVAVPSVWAIETLYVQLAKNAVNANNKSFFMILRGLYV